QGERHRNTPSPRTLNGKLSTAHRNYTNVIRSEEHTSELQSRGHLVCRLLLEKKSTLPTAKGPGDSSGRTRLASSGETRRSGAGDRRPRGSSLDGARRYSPYLRLDCFGCWSSS